MIVLGGSAAFHDHTGLEQGEWVEERLQRDDVMSALRRLVALGALSRHRTEQAIEDLAELAARRYAHLVLLDRVWQRARIVAP